MQKEKIHSQKTINLPVVPQTRQIQIETRPPGRMVLLQTTVPGTHQAAETVWVTAISRISARTSSGSGDSSDEDTEMTCTFSIECSTILNNWNDLKESKAEFVPADGWILYPSEVEFYEGETVFDVLKRVCNEAGIQMESEWTPMYNSYYVSGINNLYEFDCGKDSGWMYCVNGWYPNYGCSKYTLEDGDTVEWRYTCNLGRDVGDQYYD